MTTLLFYFTIVFSVRYKFEILNYLMRQSLQNELLRAKQNLLITIDSWKILFVNLSKNVDYNQHYHYKQKYSMNVKLVIISDPL